MACWRGIKKALRNMKKCSDEVAGHFSSGSLSGAMSGASHPIENFLTLFTMPIRITTVVTLAYLTSQFTSVGDAYSTPSSRARSTAHDCHYARRRVPPRSRNVLEQGQILAQEVPVLERSGSCGSVPYGNSTTDQRRPLTELSLNELLIQLEKPAFVTPPNPDGPTIVDIGLYIYEITEIDPGDNTFFMEAFLDLTWCDPRLRFNQTEELIDSMIFLEHDADKELEHIWWPTLFFVNEVLPRRIENQELFIFGDGTVEYREKFGVRLSTNYDMRQFPFDEQILIVEIESFAWSSDKMQFHIEEDIVGFSDEFEIPEYSIVGIEEHLEERQEVRDRHPFSELVAEITIYHDPRYYVTKIIVPLTCIVCISWAVFWMDASTLADRMTISFTGVLTSVAYQFIVADSLPRHIYNTFLDNFVLFSFIMMVLTIAENIAVSILIQKEKLDKSKKLDRMCRFLFPAAFVVGVLILAGAQLS